MAQTHSTFRNRLASETSPYLKQHETNPVDWFPWGDEALEKARKENKPILLSVGYSSCHWCHVMAHESFENEAVAQVMNENFVSIKVDREERPDLDQVYQNVAQAMTGGGGWPLTVFLLPDLRPFYGGTYFPPDDRYGRPGFVRVLHALSEAYRQDPASVEENAGKLTHVIRELESVNASGEGIKRVFAEGTQAVELERAAKSLLSGIDWTYGGIGGAPKFPNTGIFSFLWRHALGLPEGNELRDQCQAAVLLTLTKMAQGGIFDQLGGGFSRYSVDAEWSVPHFEKMLYDNALLVQLYAEVLSSDRLAGGSILNETTRELFVETLEKTLQYVLREMKVPGGAFYAAQDADSEGEEGKFFVWKPADLQALLGEEEARAFSLRYGVDESGNFEHGATVLHQARTLPEVAAMIGKSDGETRALIAKASEKLFQAREKRVKPGLDDKTLTSWSSLMISALSFAAATTEDAELSRKVAAAAEEAFDALREKCRVPDGSLKATLQKGTARFDAYLDDYAFFARAALDLTRVRPERSKELQGLSRQLVEKVVSEFRDESSAGYFFVGQSHEKLLTRPKSIYDQAIPSGTAVMLSLLQLHAEIAEDPRQLARLREELKFQAESLYPAAAENPFGHGELLCAFLASVRGNAFIDSDPVALKPLLGQSEIYPKARSSGASGKVLWCARGACQELPAAELTKKYWKFLEG